MSGWVIVDAVKWAVFRNNRSEVLCWESRNFWFYKVDNEDKPRLKYYVSEMKARQNSWSRMEWIEYVPVRIKIEIE